MNLSSDMISELVKVSKTEPPKSNGNTLYGTVKIYNNKPHVQLDGSDLLVPTPVTTTVDVKENDRVMVLIKDHKAVVMGNLTDKSASSTTVTIMGGTVEEMGTKISEFDIVIADKVSVSELEVERARISNLEANTVTVIELDAEKARIAALEAADVTITGSLEATNARIDLLDADKITADFIVGKYATVEELDAVNVDIHNLEATYGDFEVLVTNQLDANTASIEDLQTKKLDTDSLAAEWANIDFANIDIAKLGNLFSN